MIQDMRGSGDTLYVQQNLFKNSFYFPFNGLKLFSFNIIFLFVIKPATLWIVFIWDV